LDPRTRLVLFKMLNRGLFSEIHGCVSTGKEANVYHATRGAATPATTPQAVEQADGDESGSAWVGSTSSPDLAIKVYKTSILVFKDRDRQVYTD
jgi:RIO kinase 1